MKPVKIPGIDQFQQALEELKNENYALKERVLAYEYQSEATEMNIFNTLKEKNLRINELQQECMRMREEHNSLEIEIEELKQVLERQKNEIDSLQKEKNIAQLKMKKLERDAKEMKSKCSDLDQLRQDQYNSREQFRGYEEEIEKLREENAEIEQNLRKKYEKEINKLNDLIYCYERNTKSDETAALEELNNKFVTQEEKQKLKLKQEVDRVTKELDVARENNYRLAEESRELKSRLDCQDKRKETEVATLKQELRRITADAHKLADCIDENQLLTEKVENLQAKLEEITNERNYLFEEVQAKDHLTSELETSRASETNVT